MDNFSTAPGVTMNKLRFFISSAFLIHGLSLARFDPERPDAKPNLPLTTSESINRTIGDFFEHEILGFKALLPHNQRYIDSLIKKMNMQDYCIEVRGMSNYAIALFGRTNAFVMPTVFSQKSHAYLFLSEDWFETLNEDAKEALIRHELTHLKKNHVTKKVLFVWMSLLALIGLKKLIVNPLFDLNNPNFHLRPELNSINNSYYIAAFFVHMLANAKYSRWTEYEADVEAAKTMVDTQGFVDLFMNIKENVEDPHSRFRIKRIFQKIGNYIGSYFSTHPNLDERIEYMQHFNHTA